MAETVASLLRRSLEHMASDVPAGYAHLLRQLGALVIDVEIDGERFALRGGPRLEVVEGVAPAAGARMAMSRRAVLAVLDAEVALAEAVESGGVAVRGALDDVVRAHDVLIAYVHGAVRSPAPGLLEELRVGSGGAR